LWALRIDEERRRPTSRALGILSAASGTSPFRTGWLDLVVEMVLAQNVDEEMTAAVNYLASGFSSRC
jgi:hypothetical protein